MPESLPLTPDVLTKALASRAAAFRCRRTLQPAGGAGTKIFPPTYAGATYAFELRRQPVDHDDPKGEWRTVPCVLLDSVASQANRMELALQQAIDGGRITSFPQIVLNFPEPDGTNGLTQPVGELTALQTPHRIADAILRDSVVKHNPANEADNGLLFRESSLADWDRARVTNATPLYERCPTGLLFGLWGWRDKPGGLGPKFERALVSEIVGVGCENGVRVSSRIDPLGVATGAGPLYKRANRADGEPAWTLDPNEAEQTVGRGAGPVPYTEGGAAGKAGNPSKANHGNIKPTISDKDRVGGGVTVQHCEQTMTLSLVALRRLRFPGGEVKQDPKEEKARLDERAMAAQTVLAALGLCAATLAAEEGLDLRSRCLLWPDEPVEWDLLDKPRQKGDPYPRYKLDGEAAEKLLNEAVEEAKKVGVKWNDAAPLLLEPSKSLLKLVANSQQQGGQDGDEAQDGGGDGQ